MSFNSSTSQPAKFICLQPKAETSFNAQFLQTEKDNSKPRVVSTPSLPHSDQLAPPAQPEGHLQDLALAERHPLLISVGGRLQPSTHQDITMQASMLLFSIQSLKESCLTEANSCCVFRDVNVLHYLMNCVILI